MNLEGTFHHGVVQTVATQQQDTQFQLFQYSVLYVLRKCGIGYDERERERERETESEESDYSSDSVNLFYVLILFFIWKKSEPENFGLDFYFKKTQDSCQEKSSKHLSPCGTFSENSLRPHSRGHVPSLAE
jgi:hypothetical protein